MRKLTYTLLIIALLISSSLIFVDVVRASRQVGGTILLTENSVERPTKNSKH